MINKLLVEIMVMAMIMDTPPIVRSNWPVLIFTKWNLSFIGLPDHVILSGLLLYTFWTNYSTCHSCSMFSVPSYRLQTKLWANLMV
jgi:hypothetical protein